MMTSQHQEEDLDQPTAERQLELPFPDYDPEN